MIGLQMPFSKDATHISNSSIRQKNDSHFAKRFNSELEGDAYFDVFSRGIYSTDASIYQIEPVGVIIPRSMCDIAKTIEIAAEHGLSILPRGGGTSQCGQTVGHSLIIDTTKYLNKLINFNLDDRTCRVEPGLVLDELNAFLQPYGLWFPVDVSTGSRATIGGMVGNNSRGSRSIVYGTMRDNVKSIQAILANGSEMKFGAHSADEISNCGLFNSEQGLVNKLLEIGREESIEISTRFPDLMRRVGGYNLDALLPEGAKRGVWSDATVHGALNHPNLAHLLVGSEGTLAFSTEIELYLQPIPKNKVLGICHFPTFYQAMAATQSIVGLRPSAVELVDKNMIELSREIPLFKATVEEFVKGAPEALLLVEFAEPDQIANIRQLAKLKELMGDLGFFKSVIEVISLKEQRAIWEVRKAALNIMMSMRGDGKPISFIEDCAVELQDLAEFTDRLTNVFKKYDTSGTWYAHASVGCLHVRPILNLKQELDVKKMRSIAEKAFELVREYKGSHSGEHGDGLVRSEFHTKMFGKKVVSIFEKIKDQFDPNSIMNPGKIVRPFKMDDRSLMRYKPYYKHEKFSTTLDWSYWGSFGQAVEMCNNNGACRKLNSGVMCPSYMVTKNEHDLTRGRANALRLAISGQLGPNALISDNMAQSMKLCVSCKGCKRECPTGVDMARMKIEFLFQYYKKNSMGLREKLIAYIPRYSPLIRHFQWLIDFANKVPYSRTLIEKAFGFSRFRSLPKWKHAGTRSLEKNKLFQNKKCDVKSDKPPVALLADTFNFYFEPENILAAIRVLSFAGYTPIIVKPISGRRPLCCGRTFLSAGLVDEAKVEMNRLVDSVLPYVHDNIPIVGLEPSCLLTLRDELIAVLPGKKSDLIASNVRLFEEFLADEITANNLTLHLKSLMEKKVLIHGHCHQKALSNLNVVEKVLKLIPNLDIEILDTSCCGMAGAFGYQAETYETSIKMGEMKLFPAIRASRPDTIIVADGTSCRHQIIHGTQKNALHVARILERCLPSDVG